MSQSLEDDVHLLESAWFMSYPHDVFARMRKEAPVFHSERDGIWAITKYEDVRQISRSPQLFANGYHVFAPAAALHADPNGPPDPSGMPPDAIARRDSVPFVDGNISITDGVRHAFLRKIASYAFTPRAIAKLEDEVEQLAAKWIAEIEPEVEVDFIDTVAAPVPIIMIARMLGVTDEQLHDFRRWTDLFSELGDESLTGGMEPELMAQRLGARDEFNAFFADQLEHRRMHPQDDLLTALAEATWEGEKLPMGEMLMMTSTLLIAGNETTRGLLSGAGKLLAEHPDQRELLRSDPELIPTAVEEFLRMVTPVTHMCRTATEDTEIRGVDIPKGSYLTLIYPAANRDEDVWERPQEFDVTRKPDPHHLAFGFAEHFCLGASLARREARIVLTHLLEQFGSWEIVGDINRARNHMVPGITRMPVVFHR